MIRTPATKLYGSPSLHLQNSRVMVFRVPVIVIYNFLLPSQLTHSLRANETKSQRCFCCCCFCCCCCCCCSCSPLHRPVTGVLLLQPQPVFYVTARRISANLSRHHAPANAPPPPPPSRRPSSAQPPPPHIAYCTIVMGANASHEHDETTNTSEADIVRASRQRPRPRFIAELLAHPVYSLAFRINAQ